MSMTPMIDVVFLLLIFFIVTLQQQDIFAGLIAFRPSPAKTPRTLPEIELLTITVYQGGFMVNGMLVDLDTLDRRLAVIAKSNRSAPIVIKCTNNSLHQNFIQLLDICKKNKMDNLSVFSL